MNQKFKNALLSVPQNAPPIWMMRQAGRYHKHYQSLRKQHSFIKLCKDPKLAAEVALGPVAEFDFDVSILFSDLLFPLEALGMGLKYDPAPELDWYLKEISDFKKMNSLETAIDHMRFQGEAVRETRKVLPQDKSLIGFVGSPWTLFVYAVLGTHKGNLVEVKSLLPLFSSFCEFITPLMKANIEIQLKAGAEVVMIFDTAAGELAARDFNRLIYPYLNNLSQEFPDRLGYYSKNTLDSHLDLLLKTSKFAGFGYDHRWDLVNCFNKTHGFVQGNFDQSLLFLKPRDFESALLDYLSPLKALSPTDRAGWVCGLGHGVLPETPEENVKNFVKIVRETFQS